MVLMVLRVISMSILRVVGIFLIPLYLIDVYFAFLRAAAKDNFPVGDISFELHHHDYMFFALKGAVFVKPDGRAILLEVVDFDFMVDQSNSKETEFFVIRCGHHVGFLSLIFTGVNHVLGD